MTVRAGRRALAATARVPVGFAPVIFYFVVPAICGALLTLFGIRLVLRSTADLSPSIKSQYLVFGLIVLGVGLSLFLPSARVFWWTLTESMGRAPGPSQ